jgi:hypothetical protein
MPETATPQLTITPQDATVTLGALSALKRLLFLDIDEHDERLNDCLLAAVSIVERHTGQILRPSTVEVAYSTLYDWEDLPGPVSGGVTYAGTTYAGTALTLPTLRGTYPRLTGNYPAGVVVSYQAGYADGAAPQGLVEAVQALAANLFESSTVRNWQMLAAPYRRTTWAS